MALWDAPTDADNFIVEVAEKHLSLPVIVEWHELSRRLTHTG
jgi:hypothetical protein